jgi:phosphoribosyl 1,2-cyclic phosphodiesterase
MIFQIGQGSHMILKCLGSSSSGNCYLLENETECLVLECGIKFSEVKKALDFNISKIVGVLASHSHKDHFGYSREYIVSGINVYSSYETSKATWSTENCCNNVIRKGYWYKIGGFTVTPFECVHDVECLGFIIQHQEIGTLLFATDTEYVKYNFRNQKLNHILIECNYSQKIIDNRVSQDEINKGLRDRVLLSHMELETCKSFILTNKTSSLYNVCLLHLSDGNSNEKLFKEEVQAVVGESVLVTIADKGLEINLDLFPFQN